MNFLFDRVGSIEGKIENTGFQHFLLFSQCFQKPSFFGSLKVGNEWQRVKQWILDDFKLKKFADDNFKFDKYSGKFSKKVKNPEGKGEIASYVQFLFFP